MSEVHLPVTFRVGKDFWVTPRFMLVFGVIIELLWLAWILYITHSSPLDEVWVFVILDLFMAAWILYIWFVLRLDLTNEGFRFRDPFVIWKMDWHQIKKVELKMMKSRSGPIIHFLVFRDDSKEHAVLSFQFFDKLVPRHFIDILKVKAPQAQLDEKVLELFHS